MKTCKAITGGLAAVALAAGGLLVASPAHAGTHSWGPLWTSKAECDHQTSKKLNEVVNRGATDIKIRFICKNGQNNYWQTHFTYTI